MTFCSHNQIRLLPKKKNRLRCRHCHLTIKAEELGNNYCPECFETYRKKRYDFEEMEEEDRGTVRYVCEECNIIIECE